MRESSPNDIKAILLLGGVAVVLMFIGNLLAAKSGVGYALLLSFPLNLALYYFCDKLVLTLYSAEEVCQLDYPAFYGTMAYLAERAKINTPRMYVIQDPAPNAFSIGRSPNTSAIVVTSGLLTLLDQDELSGVIAHEFAHIIHRDTLLATLTASIGCAICLFFNMLQNAIIVGPKTRAGETKKWGVWVSPFFSPFLAITNQVFLSRSREYLADEKAASLCGEANWLVDGLQKLENTIQNSTLKDAEQYPFTAPLFSLNPLRNRQQSMMFSTHPPLEERIDRLELLEDDDD